MLIEVVKRTLNKLKPPPKITLSGWADRYRKLSTESSAEPGQWATSRAEFQRGIMDCISETTSPMVCLMCSSQVGKTEILNNILGYHIHHDPAPILAMQPTLEIAEAWSKDRLAPMLRDTPVLAGKIADPKARDSGNTLLHKKFAGGHITAVGANSPASLASRPIRVVLADEVDRYPRSAGTEGDPLALAIKRTTTFWNKRIVVVSTPTIKGQSRIEKVWERSDQRYYFVPCRHCDHMQRLMWANVTWPEGDPARASLHCEHCGVEWTEGDRLNAVRNGEWVVTNQGGHYPGFHISELYSPWSTIPKVAEAFVESKTPEQKQAWVNTVLGELYESDAEVIDHHMLSDEKRLEDWGPKTDAGHIAPRGVLLVTAGVDVQGDRFEIERVGWGIDEESWSVDHHVIFGDPSDPAMWRQLDAYLLLPTMREDGRELPVRTTCVDSGGHHTQAVYRFARMRRNRRVFAVKGRDEGTVWPTAEKLKANKNKKANVIIVGVNAAKDAVYARLKVDRPGPGFCHFPKGRIVAWFEQLTSEIVKTKFLRGFAHRFYELPENRKNEALDCRVYAYAALQSLGVRWGTEMATSRPMPVPPPAAQLQQLAAAQAMKALPNTVNRGEPSSSRGAPVRPRAGGFLSRRGGGGWLRG